MITRKEPRTRNILIAGLILSVLIHLIGGSFWPRAQRLIAKIEKQPDRHQIVATSDVIHLEKRAVPRPQHIAPRPPVPRPQPVTPPKPQAAPPRIEPLPKPDILQHPTAVRPRHAPPVPKANPELARLNLKKLESAAKPASVQAPKASEDKSALSSDQIAALDQQFARTIAAARTDATTITKQTRDPAASIKSYNMSFEGIHSGIHRGQGIISSLSVERRGNLVAHYTHYEYMYADGHIEEDDIPWPFYYPINADPFDRGPRELIPLQAPPRNYTPNRPLKPMLAQFFGGPQPDP